MRGAIRIQRCQDARPIRRVNVDFVRRKPGKDREHLFLDQVAHEDDSAIGHMHRLIAERMGLPACAQFDAAAAEIDRGARPAIDFIRFDDFRPLERRDDRRPERAKHAKKTFALALELVPLRFVVDDLGDALESLRAKAVLGMEVRKGQSERARARQVFGDLERLGPIRGPHAGIDDERRIVSENDSDIRHERNAPVADDEDALGDLAQRAWIDVRRRRRLVHGPIRVRGSRRDWAAGRRCVRPRTQFAKESRFRGPPQCLWADKE